MKFNKFTHLVMVAVLTLAFSFSLNAEAKKGKDGYYMTGCITRVKTIAFIDVKVYLICHYIKDLPSSITPAGMISANTDKKFAFKMLRDVESAKIKNAINEAYALNGYTNSAKYNALWKNVTGELKEGQWTVVTYTKASNATCISGSCQTGNDIMEATWKLWFGKISPSWIPAVLVKKVQ